MRKLYVSNWGDESITILNPANGQQAINLQRRAGIPLTTMLLRDNKLYVACAPTPIRCTLITKRIPASKVRERINIAALLHREDRPPGSTPNALALSPDGKRLFVVANAVKPTTLPSLWLIFPKRVETVPSRVSGFIPTGWYPTALAVSLDGRRLYVANGKGRRSRLTPNMFKENLPTLAPEDRAGAKRPDYVASLQKGSISVIDMPDQDQLDVYTRRVLANSPYRDDLLEKAPGTNASNIVIPCQARRSFADQACDLHHQRESHIRPDSRRREGSQRRSAHHHIR